MFKEQEDYFFSALLAFLKTKKLVLPEEGHELDFNVEYEQHESKVQLKVNLDHCHIHIRVRQRRQRSGESRADHRHLAYSHRRVLSELQPTGRQHSLLQATGQRHQGGAMLLRGEGLKLPPTMIRLECCGIYHWSISTFNGQHAQSLLTLFFVNGIGSLRTAFLYFY